MKKLLFLFLLLINLQVVNAQELITVEFGRCVDGDTAVFIVEGEEKKFRFLAVDTPETVHPTKGEEEGGKTASDFTCSSLENANLIQVEYDDASDTTDKYDRELAWIWVDGELLQKKLIENGYASVAYIYGNYSYVDMLCEVQSQAISDKLGIWADDTRDIGYCETKSNKTTKKATTTTSKAEAAEIVDYIDYIIAGDYDKILELLIDKTTYIPILIVLIIIYVIYRIVKKKKRKRRK